MQIQFFIQTFLPEKTDFKLICHSGFLDLIYSMAPVMKNKLWYQLKVWQPSKASYIYWKYKTRHWHFPHLRNCRGNAELTTEAGQFFDSKIEQNMGFPTKKSDWKSELQFKRYGQLSVAFEVCASLITEILQPWYKPQLIVHIFWTITPIFLLESPYSSLYSCQGLIQK